MVTAMVLASILTQSARVLFVAESATESDEADTVQALFPWVCGVKKGFAKGAACASAVPSKLQVTRFDGAKVSTKGRKRMKPVCGADCAFQQAWRFGDAQGDEGAAESSAPDEVPFETLLAAWPEQTRVFALEEARAAPKLPKELIEKPTDWGQRERLPLDPEAPEPPITIERFIFKVKPEPVPWQIISTRGAIAVKRPKEETWAWAVGSLDGEVKLVAATDLNNDQVPELIIGQRAHASYMLTFIDLADPVMGRTSWGSLEW